eukprot:3657128-Lingulodinium_polyedra.AAC.1
MASRAWLASFVASMTEAIASGSLKPNVVFTWAMYDSTTMCAVAGAESLPNALPRRPLAARYGAPAFGQAAP